MVEKRRAIRLPVDLKLEISSLFKQDNIKVSNIYAPIDVTDVSKTGIGFISESILPINYYFNARLELDTDAALNCVVKIVRVQKLDETKTRYGCEMVGMAPVFDYIFEDYAKSCGMEEE